jgi:hypothetical protein
VLGPKYLIQDDKAVLQTGYNRDLVREAYAKHALTIVPEYPFDAFPFSRLIIGGR